MHLIWLDITFCINLLEVFAFKEAHFGRYQDIVQIHHDLLIAVVLLFILFMPAYSPFYACNY